MNKLGCYWSVMHRRPQDYAYFKGLQPSVFKIMDGGSNDYTWARDNLPGSLVIARDWALSEQHSDMLRDPVATGQRHAREWNNHQQRLGFDKGNTLILGINEPKIWEPGVSEALRRYTIAMCEEATRLGLYVGAMQLSVGWPNNNGGDTLPDWTPFHGVEQAIQRGRHMLVLHEYWADKGPGENWGWWAGRSLKCPWQVPLVIGECGVDMFVKDTSVGQQRRGWQGNISAECYAAELNEYTSRMSGDPRFIGCCVFASDFAAHEWYSFDVEPAYKAILALPKPPEPPEPEPIPPGTVSLIWPCKGIVTQYFGENPEDYERFNLPGHNGLDIGAPTGTPINAIADGVCKFIGEDVDYGLYTRIYHPNLGFHSFYAHLSQQMTTPGQLLKQGQVIGLVGATGNATGPHLHLETRIGSENAYYELHDGYRNGRCNPLAVYGLINKSNPN